MQIWPRLLIRWTLPGGARGRPPRPAVRLMMFEQDEIRQGIANLVRLPNKMEYPLPDDADGRGLRAAVRDGGATPSN